ncbi:hypothetical protein [Methanococcoides burtonii]|uniref:hypothetical protein n=1 Tax=Methanococcoides burtonii TaxID=29291 RepID=UPI00064E1BFD|nr:hypothetical protein [Methanococcoides burtonii]
MAQISKAKQEIIFELMLEGKTTYRIAKDLKISWATANKYVQIYQPLLNEVEQKVNNEISNFVEDKQNRLSRFLSSIIHR